jgi:hypothetical protein
MKKIIGQFFATIRQKLFAARINREINQKFIPHLNQKADHGYPFDSDDEMFSVYVRNRFLSNQLLAQINEITVKMPRAYGDAFGYIAYRDLNERLQMYVKLAEERVLQEERDKRFVLTHA